MKSLPLAALAGLLAVLAGQAAMAAETAPPAAPVRVAAAASAPAASSEEHADGVGEPAVRRTVIQDQSARIDELRVRGQLTHVTVDPKGGAPAYEILTPGGARDLSDGPGPARGAAGKRVWNVFRF